MSEPAIRFQALGESPKWFGPPNGFGAARPSREEGRHCAGGLASGRLSGRRFPACTPPTPGLRTGKTRDLRRCGMPDEPLLCPQCQAQVHPDWPFCSHCGWRLDQSPPPSPRQAPLIPVCDNCRAAVDTTGAFCWRCGVPLSTGREPFIPANVVTPSRATHTTQQGTVEVASVPEERIEIAPVTRLTQGRSQPLLISGPISPRKPCERRPLTPVRGLEGPGSRSGERRPAP